MIIKLTALHIKKIPLQKLPYGGFANNQYENGLAVAMINAYTEIHFYSLE
jgi:hypothetical protein